MVSTFISVLAFASVVLAHPQRHSGRHRPWRHHGTGQPSGVAIPTGGAFTAVNSTSINGTDFGGAPIEPPTNTEDDFLTITVSPVPAEPTGSSSDDDFSSVDVVNNVATSSLDSLEALTPETSTAVLDITASLTAAAFYGQPTGGRGYNTYSAAVVQTTFQTAVSSAPGASGEVPAASSASAPVASSTSSTSGSTVGKKGLSYNSAALTNAFAGKGISWAYNWAATPDGTIVSGAEYVPMLWGEKSVSAWASAAASAIKSGSKHVLSLNEPDLTEQANLDAATAAQVHIANMNPLAGQVAIGSPAVTNGPAPMGIAYLNSWFKACGGQCKVDFVAFHWYDAASNFAYFKKHVQDVIDAAAANGVGKVWLTEFGASGSDSEVASFISQAVAFLDSTPAVERYAYFMASDGILVSGNSLSTLGSAYTS